MTRRQARALERQGNNWGVMVLRDLTARHGRAAVARHRAAINKAIAPIVAVDSLIQAIEIDDEPEEQELEQ